MRSVRWLVLASIAGSCSAAAAGLRVERAKVLYQDMVVAPLPIGRQVSPATTDSGRIWTVVVSDPAHVPAIRVHLHVENSPPGLEWRLLVREPVSDAVEVFESSSPEVEAGDFWTGEVKGRTAVIELWTASAAGGLQLVVDRYAYRTARGFPQGIVGPDQRIAIARAPRVQPWGRPVARLSFMTDEGQFHCTGFLLTADLLLTNQHCLSTPAEAMSALVDFDYDEEGAHPKTFRAPRLVASDITRDYALVRLRQPVGADVHAATLAAAPVTDNRALVVIGHPAGEPKQVSIADCSVRGVPRPGVGSALTDFGHGCDTLGGSSGSPVFDYESGAVVGLHHFGYLDGDPNPVNQAVLIGQVLDDLRSRYPALYHEVTGQ